MTYQDLFEALNKNKVIYVVIGGYAVNFYGYSRMTEYLDILFQPSKTNGENLLTALKVLGCDIDAFLDSDLSQPIHFRLGDPPNTIDLINDTKGLDLKEVFKDALLAKIENLEVPIITIDNLIKNKKL